MGIWGLFAGHFYWERAGCVSLNGLLDRELGRELGKQRLRMTLLRVRMRHSRLMVDTLVHILASTGIGSWVWGLVDRIGHIPSAWFRTSIMA